MDEGLIVPKLWGEEIYITNRIEYCSKWLYLSPGYVCSLHFHPQKTETFHVVAGVGVVVSGPISYRVQVGDTVHIHRGVRHCFATLTGMTLLEVSTHHEDSDVVRINESHALTAEGDVELWKALIDA